MHPAASLAGGRPERWQGVRVAYLGAIWRFRGRVAVVQPAAPWRMWFTVQTHNRAAPKWTAGFRWAVRSSDGVEGAVSRVRGSKEFVSGGSRQVVGGVSAQTGRLRQLCSRCRALRNRANRSLSVADGDTAARVRCLASRARSARTKSARPAAARLIGAVRRDCDATPDHQRVRRKPLFDSADRLDARRFFCPWSIYFALFRRGGL
jgi:hypothetical protein